MQTLAEMKVEAGPHERSYTPVRAIVGKKPADINKLILLDEGGVQIPAQFSLSEEGTEVFWILERARPFESVRLFLAEGNPTEAQGINPLFVERTEEPIPIFRGTELITACNHSDEFSKPFLFPLNGPTGLPLTWNGPPDHPHHRSVWVGIGDVNGDDLWSELPNHGIISTIGILSATSGLVYSEIRLSLKWQSSLGKSLIDEERIIRLWNIPDKQWLMDHSSIFSATYGDVIFGDTKEAGTLCVRVRESMEVENGGRIENSWGGINEAECWGKRANWCDYSGPVEEHWQGIAIFDNPSNPRHPTYWHVRDYGLMTANIFGVTIFGGREEERGGLSIKRGARLPFHYRIYTHNGDAHSGNVANKYIDYVKPPEICVDLK